MSAPKVDLLSGQNTEARSKSIFELFHHRVFVLYKFK